MNLDQAFTIIMRTKNSDWVVEQSLSAIFSQREVSFNLIVVDSGSTDNTLSIIKAYPCRLIEVSAESYVPGKILNMAIEQTMSEIVIFINSDSVLLSPYSLKNLLEHFNSDEVIAVYGRQIPRPEAELWVQRDYAESFPCHGNQPDWLGISLPLAAIKRNAWLEHPFYSEAWASEDTEWGLWAKNQGYKVVYEPAAITMHSHNYNHKQMYGRRFVEGEADVFILDERYSRFNFVKRTIKQLVKDAWLYIKHGQIKQLFQILYHSYIYQWAYYKGIQLGLKRKIEGDTDLAKGQQIILSHYD